MLRERENLPSSEPVCGGTLLSRAQFLVDLCEGGYKDARVESGAMSADEVDDWTAAILRPEH
jgi:hypothetical protein